jgi:predicted RNase H-like nuclease
MLDAALKKSREVEAHLAFQRFKNELLLGDLYVSQDVREALAGLNLALAALSAHIIVPNDTGARPLELKSGSS